MFHEQVLESHIYLRIRAFTLLLNVHTKIQRQFWEVFFILLLCYIFPFCLFCLYKTELENVFFGEILLWPKVWEKSIRPKKLQFWAKPYITIKVWPFGYHLHSGWINKYGGTGTGNAPNFTPFCKSACRGLRLSWKTS